MFATDSILPPAPEGLETLHDREYRVRAHRAAADRLLIQGAVRDQKPPGLYMPDDPDPMTIHHMQVTLEVSFPDLEIVDVTVHFEAHPTSSCPSITQRYGNLVGLSIARGFTHRVRELFGGPRGCTHTTALSKATAPVAMQCFWSMRAAEAKLKGEPRPDRKPRPYPRRRGLAEDHRHLPRLGPRRTARRRPHVGDARGAAPVPERSARRAGGRARTGLM